MDYINKGMMIMNKFEFNINKIEEGITNLEIGLKKLDYPNTVDHELFKIATMIGYYYAKSYNYKKAEYWLKSAIKTGFDTDKSWDTFLKLLVPNINTKKEETYFWNNLDSNLDSLLDNLPVKITNPLLLDDSFYYGYYKFNPALILKKYTKIQRELFPLISNNNVVSKIKVGFISSGFHPHAKLDNNLIHCSSLSDSFLPTILKLNEELFDITLLYYGLEKPNDYNGNNIFIPELLPNQHSIKQAQDIIKHKNLDILIFTDLHIKPILNYIACSKLAKVQVCTHGHPITSGLPKHIMNYFISWEEAEISTAQEHYTEELILISKNNTWEYYIPRNKKIDDSRYISLRNEKIWGNLERDELSFLPSNCNVKCNWYFCPQATFKFHYLFDEIIFNILKLDTNGLIILIKNKELYNLHELLINRMKENNIDINRIVFIEKLEHHNLMTMYQHSDVLLDSYFFGGDTTTREAFEIGTPIVTLPSKYLGGRWTMAYYTCMGITELIANSINDYCNLAVKVATNKIFHNKIKSRILNNKHKLFYSEQAIKSWENVLLKLYNNR